MGKQIQGMPQLSEQMGLCVHSGLRVLKDISSASIKGYNYLFAIDSQTRSEYYRNRGIRLAGEGRFAEAIAILMKIHRGCSDDVEVIYHLGRSCLKTGRVEEGMRLLEQGLGLDSANHRLSALLAMAYIKTDQHEKAVDLLEKAIAGGAREFDLYYRLGLACDHLGQIDKAVAAFEQALELRPNEAKVYRFMGLALEQKGDHGTALKYFKKALELEEVEK